MYHPFLLIFQGKNDIIIIIKSSLIADRFHFWLGCSLNPLVAAGGFFLFITVAAVIYHLTVFSSFEPLSVSADDGSFLYLGFSVKSETYSQAFICPSWLS